MKIAYLTSIYARASDTFIRREVQGLREMGHEVHTFSARRSPPNQNVSQDVLKEQASTMYLTEQPAMDMVKATITRILKDPKRFVEAAQMAAKTAKPGLRNGVMQAVYLMEAALLAEELIDRGVEHLHNHLAQNSATVALLASKLSGIPYSLTVHGPYIFFEPKEQALSEKVTNSSFTACITQFCKSQVKIYTPYEHWDKLKIIHCGLDETFLGTPPPPVPDNNKVVTVGRLCEEKGQMELLDVVAQLKNDGVPMNLIVVGDGPLREPMEHRAKELNIQDLVDFRGWQSSEEVRSAIQESRIMLHPSFAEGLPVVIMEALALGRPVVASRIAGVPELVEHGVNGWITTAGDINSVKTALKEAINTPIAKVTEMGLAGRRRIEIDHNNNIETAKLAQLIATQTN